MSARDSLRPSHSPGSPALVSLSIASAVKPLPLDAIDAGATGRGSSNDAGARKSLANVRRFGCVDRGNPVRGANGGEFIEITFTDEW